MNSLPCKIRHDRRDSGLLRLFSFAAIVRLLQERFLASRVLAGTMLAVGLNADLLAAPSWPQVRQEIAERFPKVSSITTPGLAEWLADAARPQPLILDVRSRAEYDVSHLPNAIWAGTTPLQTEALKHAEPDRPVVFYCSVGWRSGQAAARWVKSGRRAVFNLDGSLFQWANEGRPLTDTRAREVRVVHPFNQAWGALLDRSRWSHPPKS